MLSAIRSHQEKKAKATPEMSTKKKKNTDELELDLRSNESKQEVDFLRRRARCVKREEADMMREARHPRLMLIIQDIIFPFSCFL